MKQLIFILIFVAIIVGIFLYSQNFSRKYTEENILGPQGAKEEKTASSFPALDELAAAEKIPGGKTTPGQSNAPLTPPGEKDLLDSNKQYGVVLKTSVGDIVIQVDPKNTPVAAANFVYLAKNNFYNGTIFHRVIKDFMIQGGDPKGDGTGGPGYNFKDEPVNGEYARGTVAMANSGPNTNGSQFFIVHKDAGLPKNYVIFGHVIEGMETVDKIATAAVKKNSQGESSQPVSPVSIEAAQVLEK